MKKRKRNLLPAFLAVLLTIVFLYGCNQNGVSPYDPPEPSDAERQYKGDTSGQSGRRTDQREDEAASGIVMQGPDLPPEGVPYDEWKGISYTTDTGYDLRTYWVLGFGFGGTAAASDAGMVQDPEHIEDARLEITDVKVEPVGGEMKLRSGGYVDITIETQWTGSMRYFAQDEYNALFASYSWADNELLPFDAYTGTSLLNYSDEEDAQTTEGIGAGEAFDTGLVESDITWNGRTYRLFAKSDKRNASNSANDYSYSGGGVVVTNPGLVYTTYTIRVPADYDGAALAIDKDITDEKWDNITQYGEFLAGSDTYADILTTDTGVKQSADDYYFIRVSDLINAFKNNQTHPQTEPQPNPDPDPQIG